MPVYSIEKLSGSTDGRGIKVSATTSGGANTIHTAGAGAGDIDLIDLYAYNSDASSRLLTLAVGGTTSPDDLPAIPVGPGGLVVVVERLLLMNGLILKAFADLTNVIVLFGKVTRVDK